MVEAFLAPERVLFVHAHPDDESISTGGTIATLARSGAEVAVLTLTRGERGEVTSDELAHLEGDHAALAAHRENELARALAALGVQQHLYLGAPGARREGLEPRRYEDSGMRWLADGRAGPLEEVGPETLCGAPWNEVAADVATAIATVQPTAVVSYDADGGYGHPDHELAHAVSALAAGVLGLPFFAIVTPETAREDDVVVDVRPHLDAKRAALAAHASQLTVSGDDIVLSGGQRHPIGVVEAFRRLRPPAEVSLWDRSSTRARAGLLALLGAAGLLVGVITTLAHQSRVTVAGEWVWLGVAVALATLATLLIGLRAMQHSRLPALTFALGAYAAIAGLTLTGPGGDVVVPANEPGWWWVFGSAIVAFLAVAWPRFSARSVP